MIEVILLIKLVAYCFLLFNAYVIYCNILFQLSDYYCLLLCKYRYIYVGDASPQKDEEMEEVDK